MAMDVTSQEAQLTEEKLDIIEEPFINKQKLYISAMISIWLIITIGFVCTFCICCPKKISKKNKQIQHALAVRKQNERLAKVAPD